ncbi:MAG: TerC/Alx family metal homeostasis membrane protein [Bacteroidetes bacterium]|nr:TerC/Alx family metal homeostasis membrane protein [Bacteroidota bacterium]
MVSREIIFFSLFVIFIITILFLDLGILNKKSHVVKFKEALIWSILWISLAIGFFILIKTHGDIIHGITDNAKLQHVVEKYSHPVKINFDDSFEKNISIYKSNLSLEYITGYFIEYALSVDNVFVMLLILISFGVQEKYFHRVLFWGILGAIIMRFIFIFLSSAIIQQFEWVLYIFGIFLVFTGIKMFITRKKEDKIDTKNHPVVRFASKYFPVFPRPVYKRFFLIKNKKLMFTPLFVVLLVIEFSDVIFAVDSVPAIFSVTKDPYIVFFSNIFAILGLRSLFFLVMNMFKYFHYLKDGLSILLTFIGVKMIIAQKPIHIEIDTAISLFIVLGILIFSILISVIFPPKKLIKI